MAANGIYNPSPTVQLSGAVGTPFSKTITWSYFDTNNANAFEYNVGLVTTVAGPHTYLQTGASVIPGVTVQAPSSGGFPTADNTVTIAGFPTVAGTYTFYVQGRYTADSGATSAEFTTAVYTLVVSGPSIAVTPPANVNTPYALNAATSANSYMSQSLSISNGAGPYKLEMYDQNGSTALLPVGVGLNDQPVIPGSPSTIINSTPSTSFYVVGHPANAGLFTFQLKVTDLSSNQVYLGKFYSLTVTNSGGGSLTVTKTGQNPPTIAQNQATVLTYSVSGGTSPYTWSISGGSLPTGLVINPSSGAITGTPTIPYDSQTFNVVATDHVAVQGSLSQTITVAPYLTISGDLTATGMTAGTPYPSTVLTRVGGNVGSPGSEFTWHFEYDAGFGIHPGLPPGMTAVPSLNGSGNTTGTSVTVAGTAPSPGTYTVTYTCTWNDGVHAPVPTSGSHVAIITTSGGSTVLSLSPSSLPSAVQNQSYTSGTMTVTNLGGAVTPYHWTADFGSLVGYTLNVSGAPSATATITGQTSQYGNFNVLITVQDSAGSPNVISFTYTLQVQPSISIPSGLPLAGGTTGTAFTHNLTAIGGDGPGAFDTNLTLTNAPSWLHASINNLGVISLTGTPNVAGTSNTSLAITVGASQLGFGPKITESVSIAPITITGPISGVSLHPWNTALTCKGDPIIIGNPVRAKVGGTVTGGTTQQYTITLTPNVGSLLANSGPPYQNGQAVTWEFPSTPGTYYADMVSVDDGSVTARTTITVISGVFGAPSISPGPDVTLWGGMQQPVTGHLTGASAQTGYWEFRTGLSTGGASLSQYQSVTGTTIIAPQTINTAVVTAVDYFPDEDSDRQNGVFAEDGVFLLPGTTSSMSITNTSPLTNGAVGVSYGPITLAAQNGVGAYKWSVIGGALPSGMTLSTGGVISGTPTGTGDFNFVVMVEDSYVGPFGPQQRHTVAKRFTVHVAGGGSDPTITSITPNNNPDATTPLSVTVAGTNFLNGDVIQFSSVNAIINHNATSIVVGGPTSITCNTPVWPKSPDTTDVYLVRSGVIVAQKLACFTFGGAGGSFSITSSPCTPSSIEVGHGTDLDITISGNGIDGSCEVHYKPLGDSEIAITKANSYNSITGTIQGTIPSAYFASGYIAKPATISLIKNSVSPAATAIAPGTFNVVPNTITITTSTLSVATISSLYSMSLAATGGVGTYTWSSASTFPDGLTLSSGGSIGGTPLGSAVTKSVTIVVTDSAVPTPNTTSKTFTLTVDGGTLSLLPPYSLPDARINQSYSASILATGGATPYTYTLTSGNRPSGLNLSSDGVLSGTPDASNTAGLFSFTVTAVDSALTSVSHPYTVNLLPALSSITITGVTPNFGPITGGTQVIVAGTGFANGCTVKFGQVPALGVSFVSSVQVKATTPSVVSSGLVDVTVTNPDSSRQTLAAAFEYKVLAAPVITSLDIQDGPFAGGQIITLLGTNLQDVTTVVFGVNSLTAAATLQLPRQPGDEANGLALRVATPNAYSTFGDGTSPVSVDIQATNPQGIGTLAAGDKGYVYRPAPIITSVVPNSGPTSGGQKIYVTGKNFFSRNGAKPRVFLGNVEVDPANIELIEK